MNAELRLCVQKRSSISVLRVLHFNPSFFVSGIVSPVKSDVSDVGVRPSLWKYVFFLLYFRKVSQIRKICSWTRAARWGAPGSVLAALGARMRAASPSSVRCCAPGAVSLCHLVALERAFPCDGARALLSGLPGSARLRALLLRWCARRSVGVRGSGPLCVLLRASSCLALFFINFSKRLVVFIFCPFGSLCTHKFYNSALTLKQPNTSNSAR